MVIQMTKLNKSSSSSSSSSVAKGKALLNRKSDSYTELSSDETQTYLRGFEKVTSSTYFTRGSKLESLYGVSTTDCRTGETKCVTAVPSTLAQKDGSIKTLLVPTSIEIQERTKTVSVLASVWTTGPRTGKIFVGHSGSDSSYTSGDVKYHAISSCSTDALQAISDEKYAEYKESAIAAGHEVYEVGTVGKFELSVPLGGAFTAYLASGFDNATGWTSPESKPSASLALKAELSSAKQALEESKVRETAMNERMAAMEAMLAKMTQGQELSELKTA